MAQLKIKFKKLDPNARIPTAAKKDDVGFDLFPPKSNAQSAFYALPPGVTKIPTGIAFADYFEDLSIYGPRRHGKLYAKIEGRSGLASKGIFPVGGIIDLGYRGDITVMLANITGQIHALDLNKAIAQLVIYNIENDVEFEVVDDVKETERGDKGFGSSDQ